jgi:hypothetical protein
MPFVAKRHHRGKVMISRDADADADALEAARRLVQERLDAMTARAEALLERPQGSVVHGR